MGLFGGLADLPLVVRTTRARAALGRLNGEAPGSIMKSMVCITIGTGIGGGTLSSDENCIAAHISMPVRFGIHAGRE